MLLCALRNVLFPTLQLVAKLLSFFVREPNVSRGTQRFLQENLNVFRGNTKVLPANTKLEHETFARERKRI